MCVSVSASVPPVCSVCSQRSGRWRGGRTWLTLHVCQLLSSQVLGKQTTQSAYMLRALWAAGSLQVHGALCLICCFDVCIKIISSLGVWVLWEHWRPCKRNTWGGQSALNGLHIPKNPNRNIFYAFFFFFFKVCTHSCSVWCEKYWREFTFWRASCFFNANLHLIF